MIGPSSGPTMSCGDSQRRVDDARRTACRTAAAGCGSGSAPSRRCRRRRSRGPARGRSARPSSAKASVRLRGEKSGSAGSTPCQMMSGAGRRPRPPPLEEGRAAAGPGAACAARSARARSAGSRRSVSASAQSTQLISLSWHQALLLPRCVRRNSSPASSIGTPCESSSVAIRFRACRRRSARTSGSSVGPSTPQFQLVVVVAAVAVALAVGLVVLVVVADQVPEREAVVAGDEVDRVPRAIRPARLLRSGPVPGSHSGTPHHPAQVPGARDAQPGTLSMRPAGHHPTLARPGRKPAEAALRSSVVREARRRRWRRAASAALVSLIRSGIRPVARRTFCQRRLNPDCTDMGSC